MTWSRRPHGPETEPPQYSWTGLWEAQPFYDRPHAEIADLFDTVYVSFYKGLGGRFYKGLGGRGGCVLAGPDELIEQARVWRIRHGGELFAMWPYAVDALYGLRVELPAMASRLETARALAADLVRLAGIEILPDPPQTPIFNMVIRMWPTDTADRSRIEVCIGRQLVDFADGEIPALISRLRDIADAT